MKKSTFVKYCLFVFFLVLHINNLYGQNNILADDFYELMHEIDKTNITKNKKRELLKWRNLSRRNSIDVNTANLIFASDTIYVSTYLGPDYIIGSFNEFVFTKAKCYFRRFPDFDNTDYETASKEELKDLYRMLNHENPIWNNNEKILSTDTQITLYEIHKIRNNYYSYTMKKFLLHGLPEILYIIQ